MKPNIRKVLTLTIRCINNHLSWLCFFVALAPLGLSMKTKFLFGLALASVVSSVQAQSYVATDLGMNGVASASDGSTVAGQLNSHATFWDSFGTALDVHPSFLNTNTQSGTSIVHDRLGGTSVGYGVSPANPRHAVALIWHSTTAVPLQDPFDSYSAMAVATDGTQVVGNVIEVDTIRDIVGPGDSHGIVWDAVTGAVIADLYGGKSITVNGVGGGQQVGHELRSKGGEARMWNGSARPVVDLHPDIADTSFATATDGTHQVGNIGIDVKLFNEVHRGRRVTLNSAVIWSGTAESVQILPFAATGQPVSSAFGLDIAGQYACGVGVGKNRTGSTMYNHAVVWNLTSMTWIDLHDSLPGGFVSSRALHVTAEGTVTGWASDTSNKLHAIVWRLQ